ncbi:o-methyltransferase domain-containing protein [Penicillium maclennaniae]|uniref:o-methyltransferase domain-containing protein n=1 Tax=Penicillium maclennaniae TaxID=1343394 RepID=UPI0025406293|nr:o-methyltransferase domain-containing protein [Penicillium maclennaniae]KAJ5681917.1 o-methyltransferase domain-containing protein [Penicillium maclennaniae]
MYAEDRLRSRDVEWCESALHELEGAIGPRNLHGWTQCKTIIDLANSNILHAVIRVGADLGLFRTLATTNKTFKLEELSDLTGSAPGPLERINRYLALNNTIKEVGINEYHASRVTHILASDLGEAMVYHGFNTHRPVIQALPDFLAATKYQDITSNTNTPFQVAHNTNLKSFDWMVMHPDHFKYLQKVTTGFKGAEWTVGFDTLDIEAQKVPSTLPQPSEKPFFVDVGGDHGHQYIQLGKKYPSLLARLLLQDLPEAVNKLSPIESVKADAYDFFEKEPFTGAKLYYLRKIMHDWPDNEATNILLNIAGAMAIDSRMLIDEIVMPDTGAYYEVTMQDLAMMNICAGKGRSKQQWSDLAGRAGLRIENIHTYIPSTHTSILVLALKSARKC